MMSELPNGSPRTQSILEAGRQRIRPVFSLLSRPAGGRRLVFASAPLLAANVLEALVALARNIALAHLIAPRAFGLAISMIALSTLLEVLTDFGLPIYAVRKSIDVPERTVMATLQSLALVRAAVVAVVLVLTAPIIAWLLGATQQSSAYAMLGLIFFARGFENLGVKAMTRNFQFGREASTIVISQVLGLAATVATATAFRDFTCIVWGMGASALAVLLCSHLLSPIPYRLGWHREAAKDATAFGRPLLANGAAVACSVCDRLLVGALLNPQALALYTVAIGTAQSPRWIAVKFLTSAFVPAFARHDGSTKSSSDLVDFWAWTVSGIAFCYGLCLIAVGQKVLLFVFGATYAPSQDFMSLTAVFISISFLMHLPVPPSYAAGNTKLIMCGSFVYAFALIPAFAVLLETRSLLSFMLTLVISELIGLVVLLGIFLDMQVMSRRSIWAAVFTPLALLSALAALAHADPGAFEARWAMICGTSLLVALGIYLPKLLKIGRTGNGFSGAVCSLDLGRS